MSDLVKGILYGVLIAIFAMMTLFIGTNVWKGSVERAVVERTTDISNRSQLLITRLASCEVKLEHYKKAIPQEQAQSERTSSAG